MKLRYHRLPLLRADGLASRGHKSCAVPDEVLTYFPAVVETQYAALMSLGAASAGVFSFVRPCIVAFDRRFCTVRASDWTHRRLVDRRVDCHHARRCTRRFRRIFWIALFAALFWLPRVSHSIAEEQGITRCSESYAAIAMGTKYTGIMAVAIPDFLRALPFRLGYRRSPRQLWRP